MSDDVIVERTTNDKAEAEELAAVIRLSGQKVEVSQEPDGLWVVRIYPPGFGSTEAADNPKAGEAKAAATIKPSTRGEAIQNLLDYLAEFESGGNYNAHYGKAKNTNPKFTTMTLREVVDWQKKFVRGGSKSSAVGRYQIIKKTLIGLIRDLNLDDDVVTFKGEVQDEMAIKLLKTRHLGAYMNERISTEKFARNVAMEWASMPVIAPTTGHKGQSLVAGQSYYANDGLNKALTGVESYRKVLEALRG